MKICIFTTYNYQNDESLIRIQADTINQIIQNTDIQFVPLRYNLPNKYISFQQAVDYGMSYLLNEYDIIIFFPFDRVPLSLDKIYDIVQKCSHGFVIVDNNAFATSKEHYEKLKDGNVVDEVFTKKLEKSIMINDPELFNPFGCFLLKHKVPDSIFSILQQKVNDVRKELQNKDFVDQNNFENYLAGKNSYQIKIQPEDQISNYFLDLGYHYIQETKAPFKNIKLGSTWVNYAYRGDFNPIHTHDSLLSATIYMHQGEDIMREMENGSVSSRDTSSIPGMTHFVHDLNYHPFNRFSYSNKFVQGELIMFPSWLSHWVNPFRSNDERVTIAFNILES